MKRTQIVVFAILLQILFSMNCSGAEGVNGEITGEIVDYYSNVPLQSAQIELKKQPGGEVIESAETQENGRFSLDSIPFGLYALSVSYDGYLDGVVGNIEVSRQDKTVNLKTLALVEDIVTLDEVTVTQGRLKGEEKIDRTVFTINSDIRNASSSGLDLLRHIPSVTVDLMENVTLEGRSDIQFYVDGVKRGKDFVSQLDPKIIDRVELITNPSAKYDADISGIISIILKKRQHTGISGSVTIALPHPDKMVADPSASIEYGTEDFRLFAGDKAYFQKFDNTASNISRWIDPSGSSHRYEKLSNGELWSEYNYLNFGADWFLNEKTDLNFLGEWKSWKYSSGNENSSNRSYTGNTLDQYYVTSLDSEYHSDNYAFSLFLRRSLKQEGCDFTAEIYFNRETGGSRQNYLDTFYNVQDPAEIIGSLSTKEDIGNSRNTMSLKLDHAFFLNNVKNEIGVRSYAVQSDDDFYSRSSLSNGAGGYVEEFAYTDWRQAAYYNAFGEAGGIKWQFGATWEYTSIDFENAKDASYSKLLPQASLQKTFERAGEVKLSYERKIRRPEPDQLTPFQVILDSFHVREGNPDLDPELINRTEFAWSKNFGDNFLSSKLYYEYTHNAIQDIAFVGGDGVSRTTPRNIGKNLEYGIETNASFQLTPHWRFNGNIAVFNCEISSTLASDTGEKQQKSAYRFNASNIFTLPREFTLVAAAQYSSPYITHHRENHRDLLAYLALSKKFSDNMELGLFYVPFIKDFTYSKTITDYPGYYEERAGSVDAENLFIIQFKYSFSRGREIKKIGRPVETQTGTGQGGGPL